MLNLFEGVKVLDFSTNIAGPNATAIMADFGAKIIKIERPGSGDDNRGYAPFVEGKSLQGMWYNRGKKSVVLDAKHPKALAILKELARQADVVVESFRPGVIARMGLSYEEIAKINPRVIMCSISAFGQTGPYAQKPGYDFIAQAMSGFMASTGYRDGEPIKTGPAIGDFCGSYHAFGAIAAAMYHRERTGEGQYIDIALLEGLVVANDLAEAAFNGFEVKRSGNHSPLIAPFGLFHGNDDGILIGTIGENLWTKLCNVMGREDLIRDPAYDSAGKRAAILDKLIPVVEGWLKGFKTVDEAKKILDETGIPCAKIGTLRDLPADPQIIAREMVTELATPEISQGKIKARGMNLKFSKVRGHFGPAPALGQHTEEILREELGYDKNALAALAAEGVFGRKS